MSLLKRYGEYVVVIPKDLKVEDIENRLLLVDKPKGISSFDVLRILKKRFGFKKMGHSGTLDPSASGLMVVGVGDATKKMNEIIGLPKTYEATFKMGVSTDSGDAEGSEIEKWSIEQAVAFASKHKHIIKDFFSNLHEKGEMSLAPPIASAVKVNGVRMYEFARKKMCPIEIPLKPMKVIDVNDVELIFGGQSYPKLKCLLEVSSGTYIRSLAFLAGEELKIPCTLKGLRRVSIGDYCLENAIAIKEINNKSDTSAR